MLSVLFPAILSLVLLGGGEGIIVHAEQCSRLDKLRGHPNAYMTLRWDEHIQQIFPLIIRVEAMMNPVIGQNGRRYFRC